MTQILPFLAQTTTPPQGPAGLLGSPFVMMGLMIVMFYFLLIRPQQRQRKEQAARIAALRKVPRSIGGKLKRRC